MACQISTLKMLGGAAGFQVGLRELFLIHLCSLSYLIIKNHSVCAYLTLLVLKIIPL